MRATVYFNHCKALPLLPLWEIQREIFPVGSSGERYLLVYNHHAFSIYICTNLYNSGRKKDFHITPQNNLNASNTYTTNNNKKKLDSHSFQHIIHNVIHPSIKQKVTLHWFSVINVQITSNRDGHCVLLRVPCCMQRLLGEI